jgi:sulfite reductase (NADPH) flavoprotein alpha-component
MTLSIWRYAHLALAVVSSLFLLILSITGVVLALDAIDERRPDYRVEGFETVTLSNSLPTLAKAYAEITEVVVDHRGFVRLDGVDLNGNTVTSFVDPRDGRILGPESIQSEFIQWNVALHRSLFLKETGRVIVGVVSFLLFLIAASGIILIVKRQQGFSHFFASVKRDFFSQYFHVVSARIALVPIVILSLTGCYLCMVQMGLLKIEKVEIIHERAEDLPVIPLEEFAVFQQTYLSEVEKIEFPFLMGDPDEHFVLKLKDKSLTVSQLTGQIVAEAIYDSTSWLQRISLDLHTGRTNILWAIILGFASLNIVAFIYTGFVITFKRSKTKIRNQFQPDEAEVVLLTGSENGSTLFFANEIHDQLVANGKKSYVAEMNRYEHYPSASQLVIFTSTYGLGTAPTSAEAFEKHVCSVPQTSKVQFSVVGFGSKAYPDFCAYAQHVDTLLENQEWGARTLPLFTVNDRSPEDFASWVSAWNQQTGHQLTAVAARYRRKKRDLKTFRVSEKTLVSEGNDTFKITLFPESSVRFRSGDLLTIYPANDNRERLYSIGRKVESIELMVKLHPEGLGSGYLYGLDIDDKIECNVMENPGFHFPQISRSVAMIANGTGIAPFIGMIRENEKKVPVRLYAGFRHDNQLTKYYRKLMQQEIQVGHLACFEVALSRGNDPKYVMELIQEDALFFAQLLEADGVVMICGSLAMQRDVEAMLDSICQEINGKALSLYRAQGQLLTDCY